MHTTQTNKLLSLTSAIPPQTRCSENPDTGWSRISGFPIGYEEVRSISNPPAHVSLY